MIFIDGDFPSDRDCKYHCRPTCHPAQIGPEWVYGCTHNAWPQNKVSDFVPIVDCNGDINKCCLARTKFLANYKNGLKRRIENAENKILEYNKLIEESELLKNE